MRHTLAMLHNNIKVYDILDFVGITNLLIISRQVFNAALRSDDELFHVELYRWLLSEKLYERLLNIKGSIFLEDFLTRGCTNSDNYQNSSVTLILYDLYLGCIL